MALERSIISWEAPANETQTVNEVAISREVCLLEGIRDLYSTKAFTDVIIAVAGKDFRCHKLILAVCSPFFMAMFSNDMCEKRQERIEMKEMTSVTMELVLEYIYTGEMNFEEDTVQNLLSAANMLELIALRDGCEKFMMDKVTATNCIGMYIFAKAHQCEILAKKSKDIMNNTFARLCHEDEFLMLPYDKFIEIIQDDAINVDKEEKIYEACLAWLRSDLANRKRYLVDVMKHVRFANINCYYFCDVIDQLPMLRECDEMQKLLSVVKYQHMLKDRRCEVDLNLVPRHGMAYERGVLIISNPNHDDYLKKCNTMEFLLPSTGEIKYICKLPHGIYMPGVCVTGDNQIYMAGGEIRQADQNGAFLTEGVTASLFLFDKTFKSWQVKAKMNYARSRFALVLVDGLIYAVGGQGSNELLDVVECYNPAVNEWRVVSPLPRKLESLTAVSYRGKMYCFGGATGSEIMNSAYRYSVNDDHWIELPPMNIPRALAGSVVYKDNIYVMGGNTEFSMQWKWELLPGHCTNTVEIFNPETDTWRFGSEMPNSLCGIGVAKYGGTVIAVGGENEKCWIAGLFLLKNENGKDVWTKCQELSDVLSMFGCGVANLPKNLLQDLGQS